MIYAAPGAPEKVYADHLPTGLTGTLQIELLEVDGDVAIAPAVSGIVEVAAGRYQATITTPTTLGDYLPRWLNGSDVYDDTEILRVTTTSVDFQGANLTDLASVRQFLQKDATSTGQDAVIEALITRASQEIITYTRREYAPATPAALRNLRYEGIGYLDFKRWDLRAATLVQTRATPAGSDPVTLTAGDDYELDPYEQPDGVYTGLYLNTSPLPLIVSITGDWGWPSVPARVQHWCNVTVAEWLRRDVSAFSTQFDVNEDRLDRPESLPSAVRRALNVDRRRRAMVA